MKNKKKIIFFVVILLAVILGFIFTDKKPDAVLSVKDSITLTSPAFDDRGTIPALYTCRGGGNNPPLEISNIPPQTVSLVLTLSDADSAPKNFIHWIVWNITPNTFNLTDSLPGGSVEGENSVGKIGFLAPCPPTGVHHYHFKLYALDTKLDLVEGTRFEELNTAMKNHILQQTELIGLVEATKE